MKQEQKCKEYSNYRVSHWHELKQWFPANKRSPFKFVKGEDLVLEETPI
jgi:hypothetical protein